MRDRARIGWIGIGNMGMPMCRNLLRAGFDLIVCDLDAGRVETARSAGATAAANPAAVARDSDVVFSMVPNDMALMSVVSAEDGVATTISRDNIFVDMSTVSPAVSARIAELLVPTGALYLRAPVSGSTATAATASLSIYCSGPREAFEHCRPILEKLGSNQTYAGAAEEARILKLLVNLIVCITPAIIGEALAFGHRSGLERDLMVDAIAQSAGGSPVVRYKAEMLKHRDWTAMAPIDLAAKDLDLALDWGRANGVPMPFSSLAQQFNTAFQATGDGALDFFLLSTWAERLLSEPSNKSGATG